MSEFKQYVRTNIAEMRDVTQEDIAQFAAEGEVQTSSGVTVSISEADLDNGSPQVGDKIARNPENHGDQWLVAAEYFKDNFEEKA